jgi:ornithine cyclodeaminase/alanine dehydrogenase-like protein (mu-crystallin family)
MDITEIGLVINGGAKGRLSQEITPFEAPGVSLQDLAFATVIIENARSNGVDTLVD